MHLSDSKMKQNKTLHLPPMGINVNIFLHKKSSNIFNSCIRESAAHYYSYLYKFIFSFYKWGSYFDCVSVCVVSSYLHFLPISLRVKLSIHRKF